MRIIAIFKFFLIIFILQSKVSFLYAAQTSDFLSLTQTQSVPFVEKSDAPLYVILDNELLIKFMIDAVEDAQKEGLSLVISQGLLNCYAQCIAGKNEVCVKDLKEAMPDLFAYLAGRLQKHQNQLLEHKSCSTPCNLVLVGQLLSRIEAEVIECCVIMQMDFNSTFSLLYKIMAQIAAAESAILSAISDLSTQLTICCSSLGQQIATCCTSIESSLSSILAEVTACCAVPRAIIESPESSPYRVITQSLVDNYADSLVFNHSGNFLLAENIVIKENTSFIIEANDICFDLNGRKISGENGSSRGIQINPGHMNITIKNGHIDNFSDCGIKILPNSSHITIKDISVNNCQKSGIILNGFDGDDGCVRECLLKNCHISSCATDINGAMGGLTLTHCDSIVIKNCFFNRNGFIKASFSGGVLLNRCTNCSINNSFMNFNTAAITVFGLQMFESSNIIVQACQANNNNSEGLALGFSTECGKQNLFINCSASNNNGQNAYGFNFAKTEIISSIIDSRAESNNATCAGVGIFIDGISGAYANIIKNNSIIYNSHAGIYDTSLIKFSSEEILDKSKTIVMGNIIFDKSY